MPTEGKIKAKDLSYESTIPPFLQRLHAQNAGRGDLDRHERPVARPKRVKTGVEDDGPTVVDESGETVSKDDMEKMTAAISGDGESADVKGGLDGDAKPKPHGAIADDAEGRKVDQKLTDGTATKKRKTVRVVGEEAGNEEPKADGPEAKKAVKKTNKRAKPVKLAFDEDEET